MNKIISITLAIMMSFTLNASENKLEKVYSIVKQRNPLEWYEIQAELWVKELEKDNTNADAWLNYYTAKRMEKLLGGSVNQQHLNDIVVDLTNSIPNTFEHHYITYWNGNNDANLYNHLEKAFELSPERPETYDDFITYFELQRNTEEVKSFCDRMFASNNISANIYAWNYNMMMSTEENAILITNGDNDTYPAMVLQQNKNVRKDIAIMNIYMLTDKSYRDLYFAELGIPKMDKTEADYKGNYDAYYVDICKHLLENSDRPIYFAAGICRPIYTSFNENFYNVGLAFKWTDKKFDNIAVTRKNYEKRFLTDYMKIDLFNDISASVNNNMNASYLMPMLTLHNHYKESDEKQNLQDIEYLINQIAEKSGRTEEVQKIISPAKKDNVISKVISDPRDAYWGMVKVNDTLHASQKEVENTMYNKFLLDLLKQKRYKDLDMAKLETVNWDEFLDDRYQSLTQEQIFVHGKPEEDKFPVMNVSYEAALLYCDWLTNIYNNLEHKKKKYTKVKFRLPTEKEWEYLAKSGRSNIENYPWGDRKIKENPNKDYDKHITNSRGCFLANIDASTYSGYFILDKATCPGADTVKYSNKDGGVFPVVVGSYSPNYFGLYNIIGNVSEMVQEKGIAKGGNWNTSVTEAVINKRQLYSGPSPEVGFRVVMIIIEK